MNHTYKQAEPYALLMSGRPEDPDSHKAIAVYSKQECEEYRRKGWKPQKEFTAMYRRSVENPKGYWHD